MTTTTQRKVWFTAALIALAMAAPTVNAQARAGFVPYSAAPRLISPTLNIDRRMHWYRWQPSARVLQKKAAKFGSTVVIGLESTRDLGFLRAVYGLEDVRALPELHAVEVAVDAAQLDALLAKAPTDPRIRYVSPAGRIRAQSMPNDPFVHDIDGWSNLPYEWQFAASHVDHAFDFSQGNPQMDVGVIDTGVADHPDLAGKIDEFWSFAPDGTLTQGRVGGDTDPWGHGTAVTSIIAANVDDHVGMAGFAGASHVIVVSACPEYFLCPDTWVATALLKLDSLGVRIVNISLGGQSPNEPPLLDAIHKAAADGVLIVASAGNVHSHVGWPAAYLQPSGGGRGYGIAVGAVDKDGKLADFSNFGDHLSLVAPGSFVGHFSGVLVGLPSFSQLDDMGWPTFNSAEGAHYGYVAGTSFAAPEVAGIAALVWAARPELKNYQVADIIKQSARRDPSAGWTPAMGCGLLDAGAALELAMSRPASAWADDASEGAACSAEGNAPPTWPTAGSQTITFDPIPDKTLGDPDFVVRVTASSGLPVSLIASGNCTISGATVHLTAAGSCTITASQKGDETYDFAETVSRAFPIGDVGARTAGAVATSGKRGSFVKLPFRIGEGNGDVAVAMTVQMNGTVVARLVRDFFPVEPGRVYALGWHAPKAKTNAVYRFCVTLSDRAGRQAAPSCGRIRLR